MPKYYPEGKQYLPEKSDRAADYPELPRIKKNKHFDPSKAQALTQKQFKRSWNHHQHS